MKKEIKEINVKELIDEIKTGEEEAKKKEAVKSAYTTRVEKKTKKYTPGYSVIFADGPDIAINKKTQKTSRTLTLIFSKQMYFIYDEDTDEKTNIEDSTQIKRFFLDKKAHEQVVESGLVNYAENGIIKSNVDRWFAFLTSNSPSIRFLTKRGLLAYENHHYLERYCNSCTDILDELYSLSPTILTKLFSFHTENQYAIKCYAMNALNLLKIAGADAVNYYIEKLKLTSVNSDFDMDLPKLTSYCEFDYPRLIDYLLFDLYKQGCQNVPIVVYEDYLNLTKQYYGKITNKYPKNLLSEEAIITRRCSEKDTIKSIAGNFEEVMSETEDFSYRNPIDKFAIVMPTIADELVEEGLQLGHCVASYVKKVVNGDCIVVFMRKSEEKDIPYLTIEILPDRSVPQIEGLNKRHDLSKDEIDFIKRWAKNKHLKLTAENIKEAK